MPIDRFLDLPFRRLCDGGFAGLVFLVSRTADDPEVQEGLFRNWSDIHDLTERYLGVIVPSEGVVTIGEDLRNIYARSVTLVAGISCPHGGHRLSLTRGASRPSSTTLVDQYPWRRAVITPFRTDTLEDHQNRLNTSVSALQSFFGISESLLPCLVIASLAEEEVYAIAMEEGTSVYRLLKLIKTQMEPATARCREKDAGRLDAIRQYRELRATPGRGNMQHRAAAIRQQWADLTDRIARDLAQVADAAPSNHEAAQLRWMSQRLQIQRPLTEAEATTTRELQRRLREAGTFGRLPRRLGRALRQLNNGYPETDEAVQRWAMMAAAEVALEQRIDRTRSELAALEQELQLGKAVAAAAVEVGLTESGTRGLLSPRRCAWPITVLSRPQRPRPRLTTGWS
ncbi:hypothetical protein [Streptomyces sp. NBC_00286]|uniref:hypothetical protein n=1 Tax=Streptomyces sp. NBC_00286 TaxID=2975701 RepID=UPI002E2AF710|nr:hypothetical protein [Streptomyces sp. NBC_00286]